MVYPVPGREEVAPHDPRLMSGKYEPLVHMNAILNEEIQKAMASELGKFVLIACPVLTCSVDCVCVCLAGSPSHQVSSSSFLSGALSKCLCCILQQLTYQCIPLHTYLKLYFDLPQRYTEML